MEGACRTANGSRDICQILSLLPDMPPLYVKASDTYNHAMWPCTGSGYSFFARHPNFDEKLTFDEAIAQMRTNLEARLAWLDSEIAGM